MTSDKSGSPPCGIYIRIDDFSDMPALITGLRQMALVINRASGYEKNMCVIDFVCNFSSEYNMKQVKDMVALAQSQGLVAILSGKELDYNNILGADGVFMADALEIPKVREVLGDDAIIGLDCSKSRENVQKAILQEADFVTLEADPDMILWLKSMGSSIVSCAIASHYKIDAENCVALARAGADFVDASVYIFKHPDGVMQGTVNILYALDMAAQVTGKAN